MQEFGAILNLLPEATLLLEIQTGTIIQVNSAFLKITAFSQDELSGISAEKLFSGSEVATFLPGEDHSILMNRRNRNPVPVIVQANFIDMDNLWLLLTIIPQQKQLSPLEKQEKLFQSLVDLSKLAVSQDLDQCFGKALELTQTLMEIDHACLYQIDSEYPQLVKILSIGSNVNFPDTIPSVDLTRLLKLSVWTPGRRVLTEIHRTGRIENLSFVASVPIGQEGALFGLLVVGDKEYQLDDQQARLLDVIGMHITSALLHFLLVGNLGIKINNQESLLAVRNDLFENCQDGILILNPDLSIQKMNPSAELMLGYADVEVEGQNVENVLIGADGLSSALEAAKHKISTHDLGSVHLHRRNGQSFPARVQVLPSQRGDKLIAILAFITDVSENEQIRVRTQQLEHRALLGEFTAVFAHEVRNPINNISTGLQLMTSRLPGDDTNQDLISRMREDCQRLDHLMESVLSFSRTNETRFEPITLDIMLQRILDRWRPRLAKVNVHPFFQTSDPLPRVMGDPRTLEQVFTNLISNAIEAMSKTGGILAVGLSVNNEINNNPQVEITISDNGPGIPDDLKDRVFEPFITNNPRGTGLGLAIAKSIVTAHRGSIGLNTFPGGTVFKISLPVLTEN